MITVFQYIGSLGDGGAETLVKDYALFLDKNRFDIKVIVTRIQEGTANYQILQENNIEIIPLYRHRGLLVKLLFKLSKNLMKAVAFWQLVKKYHPDVIHVHLANLGSLSPIRRKLKGVKLLYTCHSKPELFIGNDNPSEYEAAKKLVRDNNLQIIALHQDMAMEINNLFGISNTIVINNGIDFNRFRNIVESKEDIRKSIGIPENALIIGHVGRFSKVKNHTFLLKVFLEVMKRKDNAYLLMIGSGNLEEQVREEIKLQKIEDKCVILSHRKDIPRLMKAMDVLVFPSLYEGLSIVLIEAQVVSLRCLISDTVNPAIFLSENAVAMSLQLPPSEWAEEIFRPTREGIVNGDLNAFDINKEIKKLEIIYNETKR